MTKPCLILLFLMTSYSAMAQQNTRNPQIQVAIGRSTHSTGDMKGIIFNTEYQEYFNKRFSWSVSIGGTIHDGTYPLFYIDPSNKKIDGSVRYTTGGFQTMSHIGYSFIQTKKHEFQIKLGALVRYQSSSNFDQLGITYPTATNYPIPLVDFVNRTPQRTVALGGGSQLSYNYFIKNKIIIGFLAGFQVDTNGDNITNLSLTIGKRL